MKRFVFILAFVVSGVLLFGQQIKKPTSYVQKVSNNLNSPRDYLYVNKAFSYTNYWIDAWNSVETGGFTYGLPMSTVITPSAINMANYFDIPLNIGIFQKQTSDITLQMNANNRPDYFRYRVDTLDILDRNKLLRLDYKAFLLNGTHTLTGAPTVTGFENRVEVIKFSTPTQVYTSLNMLRIQPGTDTVIIPYPTTLSASFESYTPSATWVDLGEVVVLQGYASLDNYLQVDSVIMLKLWSSDIGIPDDSLTSSYGIYHAPGIVGTDNNYFLYSTAGDNYLNGDLEVTGAVTQTQISASLTDGAPTAAELNSATGVTASTAGAGWSVTILDSDGSALLYRVESDGTNWQYQVLAIAS